MLRVALHRTGLILAALGLVVSATACAFGRQEAELGRAADGPVRLAVFPALEQDAALREAAPLRNALERQLGRSVVLSVPRSHTAAIQQLGEGKVDVAWLTPFAYVRARARYGVDVILTATREGRASYESRILVHAESGITSLEDLAGKTFLFAHPTSVAGFLVPNALLRERGIDYERFFSRAGFAAPEDVVRAVYHREVDAGATIHSTGADGRPRGALARVERQLPDVRVKVIPLLTSDPIPYEGICVRPGLPEDTRRALVDALLALQQTREGRAALGIVPAVTGLAPAADADYDSVRGMARALGITSGGAGEPATPLPRLGRSPGLTVRSSPV